MTNQEIFDLMDRFQRSAIHAMKLSREDFSIELTKAPPAPVVSDTPLSVPIPAQTAPVQTEFPASQEENPTVDAPLVGTFYAAPAPDQPPFVAVGDRVKQGQTVCLIEAMKMMSEVPAPCDCVIEAILKNNGELAAFGEPLLRYKPC